VRAGSIPSLHYTVNAVEMSPQDLRKHDYELTQIVTRELGANVEVSAVKYLKWRDLFEINCPLEAV
jgi:hypothetical protein